MNECLNKESIKNYERCILVNDSGYFFDYLTSNYNEYVIDIKNLKENSKIPQIIKYPTSKDIRENREKLIKSNATIIISDNNIYETGLVGNYFKFKKIPFSKPAFLEFVGFGFNNINEIDSGLIADIKDPYVRFIYVFMELFERMDYLDIYSSSIRNVNPSWFYNVNRSNYENIINYENLLELFYPINKNEVFKNSYKYLKSKGWFSISLFTEIFYYDLINKSNPKIDLLLLVIENLDKYKGKLDLNEFKKSLYSSKLDITEEDLTDFIKKIESGGVHKEYCTGNAFDIDIKYK